MPCHDDQRRSRCRVCPLAGSVLLVALAITGCGSGGSTRAASRVRTANVVAAAANAVTISPLPGTVDAVPRQEISFLGGTGTRVKHVRVVGSLSGRHRGRLRRYSTRTGESFLVRRPFTVGETVRVRAHVSSGPGAGSVVRTTFRVAEQPPIDETEWPQSFGNSTDVQQYRSAPALTPSTLRITTPPKPGASPGDLFLAPYRGRGRPGPMIISQNGKLVWFHPLPASVQATNFQVQSYHGQRVLTWWQGRILQLGFGQGHTEIYNSHYEPVAQIHAGPGYREDLHEVRLTAQGTAWIDAFEPVDVDLTRDGGPPHAAVSDGVVEEIDIETGLVMWEWHALGHVQLNASYSPLAQALQVPRPWDYVHVNSIDPGSNGDVLIGSRNTSAIYDVNIHTGAIDWQIGGKHSSFRLGPGVPFNYQHDAEWQSGGLISVFDNGGSPDVEAQSRGLLLRVNVTARTVTLVEAFTDPAGKLLATSQGNLLSLGDGDWLMGYGGLAYIAEYDSNGALIYGAALGDGVQSFRSYLASWHGTPRTPPDLAAQRRPDGSITVEASWNGATDVSAWRLRTGSSAGRMRSIATKPAQGFETTLGATGAGRFLQVVALDRDGKALGASKVIKTVA